MGEFLVKGYEKKLLALLAAGRLPRGRAIHLEVRHTGDCPKPRGGECRCDPDVYVDGRRVEVPTT